ncbi:hypothetical protein WBG06_08090 [Nocardioides sp. CCNWLW239]|uniref:hypothetical protein n=1 Tax=Nocardioides sp. CCNWLW239 TaxID=3128902 RepID=UPI00301A2B85
MESETASMHSPDWTAEAGKMGDEFLARMDAAAELLDFAAASPEREVDFEIMSFGLTGEQLKKFGKSARDLAQVLLKFVDKDPDLRPKERQVVKLEDPTVARVIYKLLNRVGHNGRMPSRRTVLLRSMLAHQISEFEFTLSQLIRLILVSRPELLSGNASITLAELEGLGDVASARELVIERKVDDIMRCSMDEWSSWFNGIGVKFKEMTDDWSTFVEIFARRNLMIHTGGRVSEQYVRQLRDANKSPAEMPGVGDQLDLDEEYLLEASEQLLAFGFLLITGTWLQVNKATASKAEAWISTRLEQLLERQHYRAARVISNTVLSKSRGRLRRPTEISLQIMLWTARKELNESEAVMREVTAWDPGGLDLRYSHARSVLIEDDDRAVSEIKELLRRNDLTTVDLLTSPLYREIIDRRGQELISTKAVEALIAEQRVANALPASVALDPGDGGQKDQ